MAILEKLDINKYSSLNFSEKNFIFEQISEIKSYCGEKSYRSWAAIMA